MKNKELYELESTLCRVLTHPARLYILEALRGGEKAAGELAAGLGTTKANLSAHLAVLKGAGVVAVRRAGQKLYYSNLYPEIYRAFDIMRGVLAAVMPKHGAISKELKDRARG